MPLYRIHATDSQTDLLRVGFLSIELKTQLKITVSIFSKQINSSL